MPSFVIVAPNYDVDTGVLHEWAENLCRDLQTRKESVSPFLYLQATRRDVEPYLQKARFKVFVFFGHGDSDKIFGQPPTHSTPEIIIDTTNERLLRGKINMLIACSTAKTLAKDAVKFGGVSICFFGPFVFNSKPSHALEFEECVTVGLLQMVDQQIDANGAKELMRQKFFEYSDYYSMGEGSNDINAIALCTAFYWDGSNLKIEGDGSMRV